MKIEVSGNVYSLIETALQFGTLILVILLLGRCAIDIEKESKAVEKLRILQECPKKVYR